MNELIIFVSQFCLVMLLGLQSMNVQGGHKLAAAITSFLLGVSGYVVTGMSAQAYKDGFLSTIFLAFVIAGPCGIVTSMYLHPYLRKVFGK